MIGAETLLPLWTAHQAAFSHPVRRLSFPRFGLDFDDRPYQLGVINLSRDSSYRESICLSLDHALYRARRMIVEGASIIDIGTESTGATADLVDADAQSAMLAPLTSALAAENRMVSAETYLPDVAMAALEAGAGVINLTGRIDDPAFYRAVARHEAGLILCYTPGENARSADALPGRDELVDAQLEYFRRQLAIVTAAGVERIWIDPGIGFYLHLPDGPGRARFQVENIMQTFRFRVLGWPVCVTLPSPVSLFKEEARSAETCFATLAAQAKANLIRSHEVARVQPVLDILDL